MSSTEPQASILEGNLKVLIEIVSVSDLIAGESSDTSVDCEVNFDGKVIHRTEAITHKRNPIWSVETGSLFILETSCQKFVTSNGLSFGVNATGIISNTLIGKACVSSHDILTKCSQERFEFNLCVDESRERKNVVKGILALRFRIATEDDLSFMRHLRNGKVKNLAFDKVKHSRTAELITETDERNVATRGMMNTLSAYSSSLNGMSPFGNSNQSNKILVKPAPDPLRKKETTWMTEEEIKSEKLAPSKNWVEAGTGDLGRVYVEILGCHGLPNLDVGIGNLTDAFVCVVYEDCLVQTDVIDDELSPIWMPWTQRAFALNMMHPLSSIYIGVFDYDLGPMGHDGIGRVEIKLGNFAPDTIYTLKYKLHTSSNVTKRQSYGEITIRLRFEINDELAYLKAGLKSLPPVHVNVTMDKSFNVAKYTCYGKYDEEQFDLKILGSYINEIFEYKSNTTYSIGDALRSLIYWRAQVGPFPFHSAVMFYVGITVVEKPHLLPSFFFFGIAWFMLACMGQRNSHPSPWFRCKSFLDYVSILRKGKSSVVANKIYAGEGSEETEALDKAWKKRLDTDRQAKLKKNELESELFAIGDDTIATKSDGTPINPLARFFWVQRWLRAICNFFRMIKLVITWEESILSFWITICCLSIGAALLILPLRFLTYWICKILVWVFLGPWMKLVDVLFVNEKLHIFMSEEETNKKKREDMKNLIRLYEKRNAQARLVRENVVKHKSMKIIRFGKFIIEVPTFNLPRHEDRPLPESMAWHIKDDTSYLESTEYWMGDRAFITGQNLVGEMIPRTVQEVDQTNSTKHTKEEKDLLTRLQSIAKDHEKEMSNYQKHGTFENHKKPARRGSSLTKSVSEAAMNIGNITKNSIGMSKGIPEKGNRRASLRPTSSVPSALRSSSTRFPAIMRKSISEGSPRKDTRRSSVSPSALRRSNIPLPDIVRRSTSEGSPRRERFRPKMPSTIIEKESEDSFDCLLNREINSTKQIGESEDVRDDGDCNITNEEEVEEEGVEVVDFVSHTNCLEEHLSQTKNFDMNIPHCGSNLSEISENSNRSTLSVLYRSSDHVSVAFCNHVDEDSDG